MASDQKERLKGLDSLRGMAALSVMLFHGLSVFPSVSDFSNITFSQINSFQSGLAWLFTCTPLHLFWCGYEPVVFFFVLSGFVLSLPFLNDPKPPGYASYLTKRFFRIYPPYLVALILAVLVNVYFYKGSLPQLSSWFNRMSQNPTDWKLVASHAFLIGSYDVGRFNVAFWSLVIEMRISILFPLIIWLVRKFNWKISLSVALGGNLVFWVIFRLMARHQLPIDLSYLMTLQSAGCFILGAVLARHRATLVAFFKNLWRPYKGLILIVSILAYTINCWLVLSGLRSHIPLLRSFDTGFQLDCGAAIGSAGFIIIGLSSGSIGGLLASRPLTFLGKISYSLYLCHVACILLLFRLYFGHLPNLQIMGLAFLLSLVMATVGCYLVELPTMNLGRHLAGLLKPKPAPDLPQAKSVSMDSLP